MSYSGKMLRKIWRSKTKRGVCYCLLYQSQQHGTCSASLFVHVNETTSLMFLYKIHLQIWNVILIPLKSLFFHWSFCFQDFSLWIFLQYYSDSKPTNCKLFSLVTAQVLNWTKANYEEKKKVSTYLYFRAHSRSENRSLHDNRSDHSLAEIQ